MSDADTLLKPTDQAVLSRIGDETVILHLDSGVYFGLDAVGTVIWDMVQTGASRSDLKTALMAKYDVDPTILEADIARFIDQLLENGLLVAA